MSAVFPSEVFWSAFGALVAFALLLNSAAAGTYTHSQLKGGPDCSASSRESDDSTEAAWVRSESESMRLGRVAESKRLLAA
jgi:hypothetical protein